MSGTPGSHSCPSLSCRRKRCALLRLPEVDRAWCSKHVRCALASEGGALSLSVPTSRQGGARRTSAAKRAGAPRPQRGAQTSEPARWWLDLVPGGARRPEGRRAAPTGCHHRQKRCKSGAEFNNHLYLLPVGVPPCASAPWQFLCRDQNLESPAAAPFSPGVRRRCGDAVRGLGGATTRRCQLEGS